MTNVSMMQRLKRSLTASAGTIVFGMEDGTVSIFGLVFGVAATTTSSLAVLVAGASGAAAAAVSMMAGAYLDAETGRDEMKVSEARVQAEVKRDDATLCALLSERLASAGLMPRFSTALTGAVQRDPDAIRGLLFALQAPPEPPPNPFEQALWMLLADFLSAAVPILPFFLLPIAEARIVSAAITITLLAALGVGRAQIGKRPIARTIVETVAMGVTAALAGVAIGLLIDRSFGG
jgi:VIT1/CCC1 family predicted Fe2+/Mn2+ transporter